MVLVGLALFFVVVVAFGGVVAVALVGVSLKKMHAETQRNRPSNQIEDKSILQSFVHDQPIRIGRNAKLRLSQIESHEINTS